MKNLERRSSIELPLTLPRILSHLTHHAGTPHRKTDGAVPDAVYHGSAPALADKDDDDVGVDDDDVGVASLLPREWWPLFVESRCVIDDA